MLAIGAVHVPVLIAVALLVLAAVVLCAAQRDRDRGAPVPALAMAALAGVCLLQTVPLPLGWLERIAPANADVWARALLPLGEGPPRYASVSLDPGASVVEALKWATYAGVFHAAAAVSSRRGASWGVAVVFGSALAAALTTLAHGLAGATKVFGLYTPQFAANPWHIGPLLNPNNLAGYLNLGAFCGVGLYLMRRPLLPRWLVGVGVATIVAITVTSASRAGLGVLPVGAAVLAVMLWRRAARREHAPAAPRRVLAGLVVVALGGGASLALLGSSSLTWTELGDRDLSKLDLFRSILPMLRDHPWLGIGRGAFEGVHPAYRTAPGNVVFTHAESFPLQWASEWGIPIAAAALLGLVWLLRPGRLGLSRSAVAIGAWTGVLVLLAQNLVDLALEVPAVPIAMSLALGSLWGDGRRRGVRERARGGGGAAAEDASEQGFRRWLGAATVGAAGLLLVIGTARWGTPDLSADRGVIRATLDVSRYRPDTAEELRASLRAAMQRHPAEPYFPLVGALVAWQSGRESPIPWLQRALERAQRGGRAHLLLAEILAARGAKSQALLSLRLAVEDDAGLAQPAAQLALRWTRSAEELSRAAPEGKLGARVLAVLARGLTRAGEEQERIRCAREALRLDPEAVDPRWVIADALLIAIAEDRPPGLCSGGMRAGCAEEVEAHARMIEGAERSSYLSAELRARWMMLDGQAARAEQLLAEVCNRVADRASCLKLRVRAAVESGVQPKVAASSRDLLGEACGAPAKCAEAATWLGDLMAERKAWGSAVAHYERAVAEEATEARWEKLAEAAVGAGSYVRAVEALERVLKARGGEDAGLAQRIKALKARAAEGLLER